MAAKATPPPNKQGNDNRTLALPCSENPDPDQVGVVRVQAGAGLRIGVVALLKHELGPEDVAALSVHHEPSFI